MDALEGTVGGDLAGIFAHDNEHWWTLTLHGVSYSHDSYHYEWDDEFGFHSNAGVITRIHATSFDFEFFGPDAANLNAIVSQQLERGDLFSGAVFELQNADSYDSADPFSSGPYSSWDIGLAPSDGVPGLSFHSMTWWTDLRFFATDADGYPIVEPESLYAQLSRIEDRRSDNAGRITSYDDVVNIGSTTPPLPPSLKIADGSAVEGNKGTSRLSLTVTLSRSVSSTVTVNYRTIDGTASSKSDYTPASGTVTFQPGQTSRTISISIIADKKREPNETFLVQLSSPVGATIDDAAATATIVNDD